jgi:pyruvate/2-oxoglutarate dehydrogenase complex dihydrolipoamide acyltransferase (E2) component
MMARVAVVVPDLGMKSEQIKFGQWLIQPGDRVAAGEDLFEVEADKATVVCEAPAGGTLAEVLVENGEVRLGDVLGYIDA